MLADDDYDYFIDDRDDLKAEMGAIERVGFYVPQMSMYDIQRDPVKRFKVGVIKEVNTMVATEIFPRSIITFDDLEKLLATTDLMQETDMHPEYKNPLGFILGFMLVRKDRAISRDTLDLIQRRIPELQGGVRLIKIEDVLKYGFLWEGLIRLI